MKLVRFQTDSQPPKVGALTDAGLLATDANDILHVISSGVPPTLVGGPLTGYRLLAPVPRPGKIFGSGVNYAGHQEENPAAVMPTEPGFFSKFPSSVCGPGDPILLPDKESMVDYEVELAVVIGRPGRNISARDADRHIFGFTVVNDVSDRGVQFRPMQTDLGKGFDSFCPMGPALVTADEFDDVGALAVQSYVNSELRQDAHVSDQLFSIATLIEHASRNITLEPGDMITTGTPAGCGTFRQPPLWLRHGDVVDVVVSGIGKLSNPVVVSDRAS